MNQCNSHALDTRLAAKDLYLSLAIAKVLKSESANDHLGSLVICFSCHSLCAGAQSMREHFNNTTHSLFLGICPMKIVCIKCERTFNCTPLLMKSICLSLLTYPLESPPLGFPNLGNSCYSNSILIALSHCQPLVTASAVSSLPLMKAFNIAATTNRLFNQIIHGLCPKYSPFVQEDAAEFLLHVLDVFSDDPNGKKLFNGSTKTHFDCKYCKSHTEIEQTFTVLSVPLSTSGWKGQKRISNFMARGFGGNSNFIADGDGSFGNHVVSFFQHLSVSALSLEKSLQAMFSPIPHECEKCHKNLNMFVTLETLPEILIIQLERFGKRWFGLGKMYQSVSFPDEDVDFQQFVSPETDCGPSVYSLIAVVMHHGFMNAGHYQCYARKFNTKKWFLFNDAEVKEVPREEVINCQSYLLFYQKRPSIEVENIRMKFAQKNLPFWWSIPVKILSNPKLWEESVPTSEYDNELAEAEALIGKKIIRDETEDDKKSKLITLYPYSKSGVKITEKSSSNLFAFIFEKEPLPTLYKPKENAFNGVMVGNEVSFLISDKDEDEDELNQQVVNHASSDNNDNNHDDKNNVINVNSWDAIINENKSKFAFKPIGPIYKYVELVDEQWKTAYQQIISKILIYYVVNSDEDGKLLKRITGNHPDLHVIKCDFTAKNQNVDIVSPSPEAKLFADLLLIRSELFEGTKDGQTITVNSRDVIFNTLVNFRKINRIWCVEDESTAMDLAFNSPKCFTIAKNGVQFRFQNGFQCRIGVQPNSKTILHSHSDNPRDPQNQERNQFHHIETKKDQTNENENKNENESKNEIENKNENENMK
ncbi:Clan CA, family C19 [Tritrichomonas foetus]|uniref:ubiquitinyl hydrolase 1 n=1 Tax=Tritrichomonas foetus TaxID=1144522 RepID=A0A1J4JRJ6_9EUKA|nr:Clan CA, family C19 [Tritrichomonas foetus]|eukprot:OHT00150.1 Clan CA, family C19 [Tritrichomonas foetus]